VESVSGTDPAYRYAGFIAYAGHYV
jgi:hypothetical protein